MAIIRVPTDQPTIADASAVAMPGDTIQLEPGYSGEGATITVENLTIAGDASNVGIVVGLGPGVDEVRTQGTAPLRIVDNNVNNVIQGSAGNETFVVGSGGFDTITAERSDRVEEGFDTLIVNYSWATSIVTVRAGLEDTNITVERFVARVAATGINYFDVTTGSGQDNVDRFGPGILRTGGGKDNFSLFSSKDVTIDAGADDDNIVTGYSANVTVDGGMGVDHWQVDFADSQNFDLDPRFIAFDLNVAGLQQLGNGSAIANIERVTVKVNDGGSSIVTRVGKPNDRLADVVTGGEGSDAVTVGGGKDSFDGKGGVDTLIVRYGTETQSIVTTGDPTTGAGGYGDGVDTIVTFTGVERFDIVTGAGADVITTGAGDDIVRGQGGNDRLDGGGGVDQVSYAEKQQSVVVTLNGSNDVTVFVNRVKEDSIRNFEDVRSGSGDDKLTGDTNVNKLYGGAGNDALNGGAGADYLVGGIGDDTYYIDNIGDTIRELNGEGVDTVFSSVSFTLAGSTGYVETLNFTGSLNARGTGNNVANTIVGNSGENVIDGGLGNDTLTGGQGNDRFLFSTALNAGRNVDRITDFSFVAGTNNDTIQLDDAIFTALTPGRLPAGAFTVTTNGVATEADDRIVYNQSNGELLYDADGAGGAAGIRFAILDTRPTLTASDFVVV